MLEGDGGRDVQDAATSAFGHAGQDDPGEPDQGGDVNADDVHLSCSVGSVEGAVGSEAGVVDQQIDGPVTEFTQQRQDAIAGGQVGGEEGDRAVPGIGDDTLADMFKPVRVSAGELEVEAALAQALGEDGAQAGGGAGYHGQRARDTRGRHFATPSFRPALARAVPSQGGLPGYLSSTRIAW